MLNIQMERRGKKIFPINKIPHWIDFWGRAVLLFFLFFFNECTVKEEQLQLNSYTVWKHFWFHAKVNFLLNCMKLSLSPTYSPMPP